MSTALIVLAKAPVPGQVKTRLILALGAAGAARLAERLLQHTLEQLLHTPRITTRHAGLVPTMLASMGFDNLDTSATESEQLYRMLLAGRTEVIIGDTDAGVAYYSRQLGIAPGTLRRVPIELYRSSLYIAFSRDSDDALREKFDAAIKSMKCDGTLDAMIVKEEYFGAAALVWGDAGKEGC